MTGAQLLDLFDETDGERVKLAVEVGLLVELDGEEVPLAQRRFRIRKPRAFRAGRDLVEAGIPIDQAVAQSGQIAKAVRPIAHDLVMMVVDQLGAYEMVADDTTDPAVGGSRRSAFISVVQRLRPLAGGVVAEELALAMDDEIRQHLAHLIDGLLADSGEGPEPHDQPGS